MTAIYDNWERLVRATLRREQLWISAQRTPSDLSSVSASSSFHFGSLSSRVSTFHFLGLLVGGSFLYDQILQATNSMDDTNHIKHGRPRNLVYGVLEDGTQIFVDRIDPSSDNRESYFMSELENFGKACHSALVPLGHCLEIGKDKFLVYKYMPHRGLSRSLHKQIVLDDGSHLPPLDWKTRLRVAMNTFHKKTVLNTENHLPLPDNKMKFKIVMKITSGDTNGLYNVHHECVPPHFDSLVLDNNYDVRTGRHSDVYTQVNDRERNRIPRFQQLPKYQVVRFQERNFGENWKLLEMFEDVDLVLFYVSLTDYDELYVDSEGVCINKMLASRKLMENIVTHPTFADKHFVLVLDKFYLLKEKVLRSPLTRCDWFQDFNPVHDRNGSLAQDAFYYIAVKFKRLFNSVTNRKLYVSPLNELEADSVEEALKYGREILDWEEWIQEIHNASWSSDEWSSESF